MLTLLVYLQIYMAVVVTARGVIIVWDRPNVHMLMHFHLFR
jgi:hypothetical protein